jgi:hypothetical protein
MEAWKDSLTGITYCSAGMWTHQCLAHLAVLVARRLGDVDCREQADATKAQRVYNLASELAQFWSIDYYRLLFPLRFGPILNRGSSSLSIEWTDPFEQTKLSSSVDLDAVLASRRNPEDSFRSAPLESNKLPPILPLATKQGSAASSELLTERLLLASFLANVTMRSGHVGGGAPLSLTDQQVSAVRVGIFISPFLTPEIRECNPVIDILQRLEDIPLALEVASFLASGQAELQSLPALQPLLLAIRPWLKNDEALNLPPNVASTRVSFFVAAPQRIQRYIFESPGLREIRGGSALLDTVTEDIAQLVAVTDGAEAIIRNAASTVEFLAALPEPQVDASWAEIIKREFHEKAGDLWIAVGQTEACLEDVLSRWPLVSGAAWKALQDDRNRSQVGASFVLPFEERCRSCKIRAAAHLNRRSGEANELVWICSTCNRKVEQGQLARTKAGELLEMLGEECAEAFRWQQKDYLPPSTNDLVADSAKHKLTGVLFGDGDNFGAIGQRLDTVSATLCWSRRIDEVTRAAAALAMGISYSEDVNRGVRYSHLPFEVIALGGDDMSFITAGSITLSFAEKLMSLLDAEFSCAPSESEQGKVPVTFSFGAVLCDSKAPVRVVADWAESQALKQAKNVKRQASSHTPASTLVFVVADNIDNLPANWDEHAESLTTNVQRLQGMVSQTVIDRSLTVKGILMPLDHQQLRFLLVVADSLRNHLGTLRGLATAFRHLTPHGANLHYVYQKSRAKGTGRQVFYNLLERELPNGRSEWSEVFPGKAFPWKPALAGDEYEPFTELLSIIKATETGKGGDGN